MHSGLCRNSCSQSAPGGHIVSFIEYIIIIGICTFVEIEVKAQLPISNVSFTYYDTDFAFFQTSPYIDQPDAQTQCINWGGNLATINSAVEDDLLFYSIPDLETTFTCHIGLKDIDNANDDGDAYVWIDGSISTYRKWGTLTYSYPLPSISYDCVRHRYRTDSVLSEGWLNAPCSNTRNCYFCNKQGI